MMAESNIPHIGQNDDDEEEAGEVIESAPPLRVGDEREYTTWGIKKKLLKAGIGWECPEFGDQVTVHYVGTLLDGTKFVSTEDDGEPLVYKVGSGQMVSGLDHGVVTMNKGERALFTLPPKMGYGEAGRDGIPPNSIIQFEVELISWMAVVDVCKDGGIIKRILEKGEQTGQPGDLDEVRVKYVVMLVDGVTVAQTPEAGIEFYVKDGHFCPAIPNAVKTMSRGEKVNLTVQPQYAYIGGDEDNCSFPMVPRNCVLSINLELVSFNCVIHVTDDSKVIKKIVREGQGPLTADDGTTVTIRYAAMLEDGTVFEKKGYDGEEPLEFITDEELVIEGLDLAVATMRKGERAIVTIAPEYGFGSTEVTRDLATIPPFSTLVFDVEMLNFLKERAPWEMINDERILTAEVKKEEGNELFKRGKHQRAWKKYEKAAAYVSEDVSFEDEKQKLAKSLRVSCWLNSAACCLKLNDFKGAIKLCSQVLEIEFSNVKALYRRAQAYIETADLHLAELDIKKALEADPLNREVKAVQQKLRLLQAESNKRDAKLYTNMFSRMTQDISTATKRMKLENVDLGKKDDRITPMDMETVPGSTASPGTEMIVDS